MKGRMRPYLPELTIRDYNTYMRYLRGVRRQMYKSYGFYACHLLRTNGVLFAILSDSLAGRMPTCKRQRVLRGKQAGLARAARAHNSVTARPSAH